MQDEKFELTMAKIECRAQGRDKKIKELKQDEKFYKQEAREEERRDQGEFMRDFNDERTR
jgi:hypothetical protein